MKKVVFEKKGFTLIELLIASAIIGILSVVSSQIVLSILENQDQAIVVNEIRQNGDLAIVAFERDARKAIEMQPAGSGRIIFQTSDSSVVTWICDSDGIKRSSALLTSAEPNTGVELVTGTCSFSANSITSGVPQLVTWEFTLKSRRSDINVEVPFRTSIQSRIQ